MSTTTNNDEWRTGLVCLDELVTVRAQWHNGTRWNGFLCPWFDAFTVEQIMTALAGQYVNTGERGPSHQWQDDGSLIVTEYDGDTPYPHTITPDDDGLYSVGAFSWVWSQDDESENLCRVCHEWNPVARWEDGDDGMHAVCQECASPHVRRHFYRSDISDWWCPVCDTITDYCDALNPGARTMPAESSNARSTAEITVRLSLDGAPSDAMRAALDSLASVMAVQAEDGLYSLGSPEAEDDNGPSVFVAQITETRVSVVLRDGDE